MNTVAETGRAGLWSVEEIEAGVESVLFRQLLRERMRQTPNEVDRELQELALDAFEEWANGYGLPTTPHVLAAYLVELHSEGEQADILEFVAAAYLNQNKRDVHVPIRAALQYCSKSGGYKQRTYFKKGGRLPLPLLDPRRHANGVSDRRLCREKRDVASRDEFTLNESPRWALGSAMGGGYIKRECRIRVKMRRPRSEHMSAGLPPIADIARRGWHGRNVWRQIANPEWRFIRNDASSHPAIHS
jgi:hypothetical protein